MKQFSLFLALGIVFVMPVQAQTNIYTENFEGGTASWVDLDRNPVTLVNSGGAVNNGKYISLTTDIDTTDTNQFTNSGQGAAVVFRCSKSLETCSGGSFGGNWFAGDTGLGNKAVTELSYWFRHNSAKPGGLEVTVRFATPFNSPGASGVFTTNVPANTWTKLTLNIDPQNPIFDKQFGAVAPDFPKIAKNVDRLQPGIYIDPNDPDYFEAGVTFDLDQVQIKGKPAIPAVVNLKLPPDPKKNKLHPQHAGPNAPAGPAINDLDDPVPVIVYGSSTGAGDPANLNTDNIISSSVRIGPLGGIQNAIANGLPVGPTYNLDDDSDGLEDAKFASKTSTAGYGSFCGGTIFNIPPTDVAVRGELTTGEIFAGFDTSILYACSTQCHDQNGY